MSKRIKIFTGIAVAIISFTVILSIYFGATPSGKKVWNNWFHAVQKANDNTSYETKKTVEDTCRAMIASYNADKLIYIQNKDSENSEERSWASQAKMRANQTASSYNNYIIKNSYIWHNNIPSDIYMTLDYLE